MHKDVLYLYVLYHNLCTLHVDKVKGISQKDIALFRAVIYEAVLHLINQAFSHGECKQQANIEG